jgi:hypothetical protein
MYAEGHSPVDVVKELDIPHEDAEKFYSDYCGSRIGKL